MHYGVVVVCRFLVFIFTLGDFFFFFFEKGNYLLSNLIAYPEKSFLPLTAQCLAQQEYKLAVPLWYSRVLSFDLHV